MDELLAVLLIGFIFGWLARASRNRSRVITRLEPDTDPLDCRTGDLGVYLKPVGTPESNPFPPPDLNKMRFGVRRSGGKR